MANFMKTEYRIDENKIGNFYRVQAMKVIRITLMWALPLILVDMLCFVVDKPVGTSIVGGIMLSIIIAGVLIRHFLKPELKWMDLKIVIDYETGEFSRTGTGISELIADINEFGRIVKHKEGIKLFKKGWPSWISYLSNYSNLNERSWNFYIPSVLEKYEEIEKQFKEQKWL